MDEDNYKRKVLSIINGGAEECREEFSSILEFKQDLKEAAATIEENLEGGWVFWQPSNYLSQIQHKIIALLRDLGNTLGKHHCLVQFWAAVRVEGGHHHLSISNQPFLVSSLSKGLCWYRRVCVDMDGAEAEQLGSIGRTYRNKYPESTPDLRLYSTTEFPLRDYAARCGFRGYLALPLFDFDHQNQCCGVLELLSGVSLNLDDLDLDLFRGLQIAGLRSTHINIGVGFEISDQVGSEIGEMLELAIKAVPRLSLALVWIPCKRCDKSSCMEIASYMQCDESDEELFEYFKACTFHNLQIDLNSLGQDLSDVGISKNPFSHYAEKARLSRGFALCLQSVNNNSNHLYAIEFFLQPKYREDVCGDSSLHMLFRIMEMKLKSFKLLLGGKLLQEFVLHSKLIPNPIDLECIDLLKPMKSEIFSESNFTNYLETRDSCCLRPSKVSEQGWVFQQKEVEEREPMKEKIQLFMKEIVATLWSTPSSMNGMIQFWAPKMVEDRCCLQTWDQPYALGGLDKRLASFRRKCMGHQYFADDKAKEEELGPPGRVFKNGCPEFLFDLFLFTTKEFPMRSYALHCGVEQYFVLPIFDEHQQFNKHNCVGVLEFIDIADYKLEKIIRVLEVANLRSSHIHILPIQNEANIHNHMIEAITEVKDAFHLFTEIPQCHMAHVWIQYEKCMSSKCMRLLFTSGDWSIRRAMYAGPKLGITRMVLESKTKSLFCQNILEFSISEQPACYGRNLRCNACFTICLQSSHTGDLLYVFDFFLYRSPATYDYLRSFLNFLLPVLKYELKSFKVASGKQLGDEELVVEIIEFSEANQLTFPESDQLDVFPVKFRSVFYGKKQHQHIEEEQVQLDPEVGQRKQDHIVASTFKKTDKGKRKSSLHLSLEVLKPYFGKKLEDVAKELGVGRSTIKRACRDYGINWWPGNKKQAMNPYILETESIQDHHHEIQGPSSSSRSSHQVLDTYLQQNTNTQPLLAADETEKVMIKVRSEEDFIRFELCLSLGVVKLREEVARRLNLKMDSFKLKYMDEDNEEILIACDEDLQLCPKTRASMGKNCIQLFIPK